MIGNSSSDYYDESWCEYKAHWLPFKGVLKSPYIILHTKMIHLFFQVIPSPWGLNLDKISSAMGVGRLNGVYRGSPDQITPSLQDMDPWYFTPDWIPSRYYCQEIIIQG